MSGKEFFVKRYEMLGWKYANIVPKQAIRINSMKAKEEHVVKRLESLGIKLEKIPFLKNGYWVLHSEFSVGVTTESKKGEATSLSQCLR